jgi:hypothetical protein
MPTDQQRDFAERFAPDSAGVCRVGDPDDRAVALRSAPNL